MSWITIGSKEDIARKERSALNAYMFWTNTDCKTMTISEALIKFGRELWWDDNTSFSRWCKNLILSQDNDGLKAMRSEYTKKTGEDWKTARLGDVLKTLGFCQDLYREGSILYDGRPNIRAELSNSGVDVSKGKAKEVVETIESSSVSRITYTKPKLVAPQGESPVELFRRVANEDSAKGEQIRALLSMFKSC